MRREASIYVDRAHSQLVQLFLLARAKGSFSTHTTFFTSQGDRHDRPSREIDTWVTSIFFDGHIILE